MTTLQDFKSAVRPGTEWLVTNHYIQRVDHPCYGTTRRLVMSASSGAFTLTMGDAPPSRVEWPKASEVERTANGWRMDRKGALFLELVPA